MTVDPSAITILGIETMHANLETRPKSALLLLASMMCVGLYGCGSASEAVETNLIESLQHDLNSASLERQQLKEQIKTLSDSLSELNSNMSLEKPEPAYDNLALQVAALEKDLVALRTLVASEISESEGDEPNVIESKVETSKERSKEYFVKALKSGQRKAILAGLGTEMSLRATIIHSDLAKRIETEDDPRIPLRQLSVSDRDTVFILREFYPEFLGGLLTTRRVPGAMHGNC